MEKMIASIFPKGPKDIDAITDELMRILDNKIRRQEARNIAIKSTSLSRIAEKFDEERLKLHLKGYCLHHFNDQQIK